jgi:hypothetical protein
MESVQEDTRPAQMLLDIWASARALSVSDKTIKNMVDRGLLKPVYIYRRRLFRRTDIERLARTGTK